MSGDNGNVRNNRTQEPVAVVTGAARGIGFATAKLLAEQGILVYLLDRDGEGLQSAISRLGDVAGTPPRARQMDVLDPSGVQRIFDQIIDDHNGLDILINNVGGTGSPPGLEAGWVDAERELDLCLTSMFTCSQAAIPGMLRRGSGAIASVASSAARYPADLGGVPYCAGKAGVLGLTRALATEFGSASIRVNAVLPGNTLTEQGASDWQDLPPEKRQTILQSIPLGRLAQPVDIAEVLVFLVSPESEYITGECIDVNGGHHMN